jgi:hypothetical protein
LSANLIERRAHVSAQELQVRSHLSAQCFGILRVCLEHLAQSRGERVLQRLMALAGRSSKIAQVLLQSVFEFGRTGFNRCQALTKSMGKCFELLRLQGALLAGCSEEPFTQTLHAAGHLFAKILGGRGLLAGSLIKARVDCLSEGIPISRGLLTHQFEVGIQLAADRGRATVDCLHAGVEAFAERPHLRAQRLCEFAKDLERGVLEATLVVPQFLPGCAGLLVT